MKEKILLLLIAVCTAVIFSGCEYEFPAFPITDNSEIGETSPDTETEISDTLISETDSDYGEGVVPSSEDFPQTEIPEKTEIMKVHFLDVGQADSTFIELPDGRTMLIDAGTKEAADGIVTYIFEQGYDRLDYVIATHAHDDHIGGMTEVLNNFSVGKFFTTAYADSESHSEALAAAEESGGEICRVQAGEIIIDKENLLAEVSAPKEFDEENTNNNSIVISLTYGESRFVFAGDAEKSEEDGIWSNIKCDVLKVGHHGSSTSTSANFLKKTEPRFAVISAGLNNSYGHPSESVLKRLYERNIGIFRTDLMGTVVFTSDGSDISVNKTPWEYVPAAELPETESDIQPENSNGGEVGENSEYSTGYVLNTKTGRIHSPRCPAVKDIKEKNKAYTDDYRQAIENGYVPCGICGGR